MGQEISSGSEEQHREVYLSNHCSLRYVRCLSVKSWHLGEDAGYWTALWDKSTCPMHLHHSSLLGLDRLVLLDGLDMLVALQRADRVFGEINTAEEAWC